MTGKNHKYKVTVILALSKIIEAPSKKDALELFSEHNAYTKLIKQTATRIK